MSDLSILDFVLENPNKAAEELEQLRKLKAQLIKLLNPARERLCAPMPENLELYQQHGEYAERCGYARGAITIAVAELQK